MISHSSSYTNLDIAVDQCDNVINCHLHHNMSLWCKHSIIWLRHTEQEISAVSQ